MGITRPRPDGGVTTVRFIRAKLSFVQRHINSKRKLTSKNLIWRQQVATSFHIIEQKMLNDVEASVFAVYTGNRRRSQSDIVAKTF